jgi:hypothetical protein
MRKSILVAAMPMILAGCGALDRHLSQNLEVVEAGDERQQIYFRDKLLYEGHVLGETWAGSTYTFFVVDMPDHLCSKARTIAYFGSSIRQVTVTDTTQSKTVLPSYSEAMANAKRELARLKFAYPQFFMQGQPC